MTNRNASANLNISSVHFNILSKIKCFNSIYIYIYIYCLATLMSSDRTKQICLWMTIEIYILPYPSGVEFSGEEVIVLPLASIASLFVVELRSRLPLNGCM